MPSLWSVEVKSQVNTTHGVSQEVPRRQTPKRKNSTADTEAENQEREAREAGAHITQLSALWCTF